MPLFLRGTGSPNVAYRITTGDKLDTYGKHHPGASSSYLARTIMVKRSASFSRLHHLLQQVSNEETLLALDIARRRSACLSVDAYPPHLARIISNVPNDAVSLFTALLSLRALQIQMVVGSKRSKAAHYSESWELD